MDVKRTQEAKSLVSPDTSQFAVGGKLKRKLIDMFVQILDKPSNQSQDRLCKDCRAKLTQKMFFRAFSNSIV